MNEQEALKQAIKVASQSPCDKSKRGVVIFHREYGIMSQAFNAPPMPFMCTEELDCREQCSERAVHAEQSALLKLIRTDAAYHDYSDFEMLHVKVVKGEAVPSKEPCCWQCSKLILAAGIKGVWLLEESGLRFYSAHDFHAATLANCDLF